MNVPVPKFRPYLRVAYGVCPYGIQAGIVRFSRNLVDIQYMQYVYTYINTFVELNVLRQPFDHSMKYAPSINHAFI
jgi:hypothetical protein